MGRRRKPRHEIQFSAPSALELVGQFEAWQDDFDKSNDLKAQAKEIDKSISETIKSYSNQVGCKPAEMKRVWRYWQRVAVQGEMPNDNEFTLMALVDSVETSDIPTEEANMI